MIYEHLIINQQPNGCCLGKVFVSGYIRTLRIQSSICAMVTGASFGHQP